MTGSSLFAFRVTGTEYREHSTLIRPFEQDGVIRVEEGEGMGTALARLIHSEIEWDILDGEQPVTIEIEPRSEAEQEHWNVVHPTD
jgi:hypothetical protein